MQRTSYHPLHCEFPLAFFQMANVAKKRSNELLEENKNINVQEEKEKDEKEVNTHQEKEAELTHVVESEPEPTEETKKVDESDSCSSEHTNEREGGEIYLIHATHYNVVHVSNPRTGEMLTARVIDHTARPRKYLDYFYARLSVSPGQSSVVTGGWVWHPIGVIHCFSLEDWMNHNVYTPEQSFKSVYDNENEWYSLMINKHKHITFFLIYSSIYSVVHA